MRILLDHNLVGDGDLLMGTLAKAGWLDLVPLELVTFTEVGLLQDASDREVWQFVQAQRMLLLTDNRNMEGADSLEQVLREEVTATTYPVLTISKRSRLDDPQYREQCAARIVAIVVDLELYLGCSRLFIP